MMTPYLAAEHSSANTWRPVYFRAEVFQNARYARDAARNRRYVGGAGRCGRMLESGDAQAEAYQDSVRSANL
jgi:hypothetical protein